MKENKKVVALEADLGGASGFTKILKTNPEQFIQMGIAEANMVGVAAGRKGHCPCQTQRSNLPRTSSDCPCGSHEYNARP